MSKVYFAIGAILILIVGMSLEIFCAIRCNEAVVGDAVASIGIFTMFMLLVFYIFSGN